MGYVIREGFRGRFQGEVSGEVSGGGWGRLSLESNSTLIRGRSQEEVQGFRVEFNSTCRIGL